MEIDRFVEKTVREHGMRAAEKGYCGYPASICVSINDEVVHGIPSKKRHLREGDIVSCDLVVEYDGYMADAARTYAVGTISPEAKSTWSKLQREHSGTALHTPKRDTACRISPCGAADR